MGENTKISWAHHTFNPWIGCSSVSPGCKFCYAQAFAENKLHVKWGNHPRHITAESTLAKPLAWQRKAKKENTTFRVFCASLSDVFERNQELTEVRERLWKLIEATPNLTWLLLTKRPQNYKVFFKQLGTQLAKKLKLEDSKGENGLENLPPTYDWLKIREIPFEKQAPSLLV